MPELSVVPARSFALRLPPYESGVLLLDETSKFSRFLYD